MGGNVTALNKKTGQEFRAEKIPLSKIGVQIFRKKILELFKSINITFKKSYGEFLWNSDKMIEDGTIFNGSTSFIMDPGLDSDEISKIKPSAGDIDVVISISQSEQLYDLLDSLEGELVCPGCRYMGAKNKSRDKIGNQINSIFKIEFLINGRLQSVLCQVDFELVQFSGGTPTEWAKFSHSSSFEDAKSSIKAVHHKYIIRAFIGASSARTDVLIATPASTPEKIKVKQSNGKNVSVANMMKFSVGSGARLAFLPMLDSAGNKIYIDGKEVLKEIPTTESDYKTSVESIFELVFSKKPTALDKRMFWSFIGVIELMKKNLSIDQLEKTNKRYVELLWGPHVGQRLERGNPELDLDVKLIGYKYWIDKTGVKDLSVDLLDKYYALYPRGENSPDDNVDEFI